ncbi:hypothetical protein ACGFT2_00235 [Streptomyces sp. NPDC048514]|uniref:hypothetical protein n=1 Tax=Streptomyces sp. NPDC048514 TaxID=3365564 RepID=UPI003724A45E
MHRSTTTAALLVTVAVSALSGCMRVDGPATPALPADTAASQPTAPPPDGSARPRAVQAPAREALEMVGPSRRPQRAGPPASRRPAAASAAGHRPPPAPAAPAPARAHPHPPRRPHIHVPEAPRPVPKPPDVCALGRQYGGWRGDSPEAVICRQAYGH